MLPNQIQANYKFDIYIIFMLFIKNNLIKKKIVEILKKKVELLKKF